MNTFEGNYFLHSLHGTVVTFVTLVQFYSSDRLADEAISIAIATKENLSHQRGMFSGAAGRMGAVACILLLYIPSSMYICTCIIAVWVHCYPVCM